MKRRNFLKNAALATTAAMVSGKIQSAGYPEKEKAFSYEESNLITRPDSRTTEAKGKVPTGKIKNVTISRIIVGGNLFSGFAHARDLIYVSKLMKTYFTDEKVVETLFICEDAGINTAVLRVDDHIIRILNKYRRQGGKIQWLAQADPDGNDMTNVKLAIDNGATGAFVHGGTADQIVAGNKMEYLQKPIELIQSQGLIAGTAGHSINVPLACVKHGIRVDFFMKTFHSNKYWSSIPFDASETEIPKNGPGHNQAHDNIFCMSAEAVTDFFRNNTTPWLAYKVLAAGAINPNQGFRHAFESGADFLVVGMFDFQVADNSNLVCEILGSDLKRERKWYG
jgi:hypothetical protein